MRQESRINRFEQDHLGLEVNLRQAINIKDGAAVS